MNREGDTSITDYIFTCLDCGREYGMTLEDSPSETVFPDDEDLWCDVCRGEADASDYAYYDDEDVSQPVQCQLF